VAVRQPIPTALRKEAEGVAQSVRIGDGPVTWLLDGPDVPSRASVGKWRIRCHCSRTDPAGRQPWSAVPEGERI